MTYRVSYATENRKGVTAGFCPGFMAAAGLAAFLLIGSFAAFNYAVLCKWAVICILFHISIWDIQTRKIPNSAVLSLIGLRLCHGLAGIYHFSDKDHLITLCRNMISKTGAAFFLTVIVAAVSLLTAKIIRKQGIGKGDMKLIFAAALYLGLEKGLYLIFLSCLLGLAGMAGYKRIAGKTHSGYPFGPAISAAFLILLIIH